MPISTVFWQMIWEDTSMTVFSLAIDAPLTLSLRHLGRTVESIITNIQQCKWSELSFLVNTQPQGYTRRIPLYALMCYLNGLLVLRPSTWPGSQLMLLGTDWLNESVELFYTELRKTFLCGPGFTHEGSPNYCQNLGSTLMLKISLH